MASVQPVLKATADLVYTLLASEDNIPQNVIILAEKVERALMEYQLAVDFAQEQRTNYRVHGKKRK